MKVKEVFAELKMKRLDRDVAFYHCHDKEGDLKGMISNHVDDFILASTEDFIKKFTQKIKEKLDISKLEDEEFRFTIIEIKKVEDGIEI